MDNEVLSFLQFLSNKSYVTLHDIQSNNMIYKVIIRLLKDKFCIVLIK